MFHGRNEVRVSSGPATLSGPNMPTCEFECKLGCRPIYIYERTYAIDQRVWVMIRRWKVFGCLSLSVEGLREICHKNMKNFQNMDEHIFCNFRRRKSFQIKKFLVYFFSVLSWVVLGLKICIYQKKIMFRQISVIFRVFSTKSLTNTREQQISHLFLIYFTCLNHFLKVPVCTVHYLHKLNQRIVKIVLRLSKIGLKLSICKSCFRRTLVRG